MPSIMSEARKRFAELAARPDGEIDVAEAALVIAQEEYPALEVDNYLKDLDDLAAAAGHELRGAYSATAKVARLNHFLFVQCGFTGNSEQYYDARNSFLNEVLERRTGIPITLSIVYCEVGQRLGLPVYGVSFPGHFLVKCVAEPEIIIDAFFGTIISLEECERRLRGVYGSEARLEERLLRPATPRAILARMLSNLKQVYVEQRDLLRALACVDRILLLTPEAPRELRDRGILYHRLECFAAALRDLERYLQRAPDDDGADAVRAIIPGLRLQAQRLQ
jgi:regulator of sirC expression with transglutaminase-like and TPR domain